MPSETLVIHLIGRFPPGGQYVILVLNHVGQNFLRDTTITSQEGSHINPEYQRSWTTYPTYPRMYLKLSLSQPSNYLCPSFLKIFMPVNSLCLVTHQPRKKKGVSLSLFIFFILMILCVSSPLASPLLSNCHNILHFQEISFHDEEKFHHFNHL